VSVETLRGACERGHSARRGASTYAPDPPRVGRVRDWARCCQRTAWRWSVGVVPVDRVDDRALECCECIAHSIERCEVRGRIRLIVPTPICNGAHITANRRYSPHLTIPQPPFWIQPQRTKPLRKERGFLLPCPPFCLPRETGGTLDSDFLAPHHACEGVPKKKKGCSSSHNQGSISRRVGSDQVSLSLSLSLFRSAQRQLQHYYHPPFFTKETFQAS
jgi:hypothetical protein